MITGPFPGQDMESRLFLVKEWLGNADPMIAGSFSFPADPLSGSSVSSDEKK